MAARRVENGLVHPYFSQIREALEKQLEGAPRFEGKTATKKLHQKLAQTYLKDAERYGQSGLVGKNQKRDVHRPPTPLEKLESLPDANKGLEGMRGFLRVGESLQQHAEPEPELVVILELQQAPDGQLRSVQVVEPSGNTAFDKYVTDAVPPSLARLTPPPSLAQAHASYLAGLELERSALDDMLNFYGSFSLQLANRAALRMEDADKQLERARTMFSANQAQIAVRAIHPQTAR